MREPNHGFTRNLEELAAEVTAPRRLRGEDFTQSQYAGLQSGANRLRRLRKYAECEYWRGARRLTALEVSEFRAAVDAAIVDKATAGVRS